MNTFGQSYVQGSQAELLFGLFDPREVYWNRERFRREALPLLVRANSLYCPAGRYPCRGWLLMRRQEYDQLNKYSTSLQLDIANTALPNNVGPLKKLSIVQAQCVTRGLINDPNAIYLVEVTDRRGILHNRWFSHPINTKYNIRAPAYPQGGNGSGTYYTASMNGGTTWTWTTMLQDIWDEMTTFLGTWPGLPAGYDPGGTPEGFWFTGTCAWTILNDILDHLGLAIVCNLTQSNPYTIVRKGIADASLTALQVMYATRIEDDLEWIDIGAGRVPASVTIFFKRRNSVYGNEETVRRDSLQWSTDAVYSVSVAAPTAYTNAAGIHHLWSDFTVRYDQDGVILAADATTAATIAAQRAAQYYAIIDPAGYMKQTYTGALPFITGSQCDGVCWYQDLRSNDYYGGWRTQIVHGYNPPWPDMWDAGY